MEVKTTIKVFNAMGYLGIVGAFLLLGKYVLEMMVYQVYDSEIVGMAIGYVLAICVGCMVMFAISNTLELLQNIAKNRKIELNNEKVTN